MGKKSTSTRSSKRGTPMSPKTPGPGRYGCGGKVKK